MQKTPESERKPESLAFFCKGKTIVPCFFELDKSDIPFIYETYPTYCQKELLKTEQNVLNNETVKYRNPVFLSLLGQDFLQEKKMFLNPSLIFSSI